MFEKNPKFSGDDAGDDEDRALLFRSAAPTCSETGNGGQKRRTKSIEMVAWVLALCITVNAAIAVWLGIALVRVDHLTDADGFCLQHISQYSPLVKEVKPGWRTVQYNGTFFHANVYRQEASPEVDAAWEALGTDYRSIVVPESEASKTGLRRDQVKVSQLYGGGYPANVEGLHHLHCLNLLRKALRWNYEYYREKKEGAFVNSEYVIRYHVTHCLDIVRQQLMCTTGIGVLGQVWYQPEGEEQPIPFVDFSTKHRCRDFEAIRQWAEAHQLPPETEVDMSRFYERPGPGDTIYPEIP
ncbi:hypothetical protein M011DRAFT_452013 [Sporormia fimetaria CBS 119925]|uniref:Tat pathway signal sequence n=1 Tax=Sporormia fimetaria CBS 119925 TaxID=1340428 RepID=A0A6A6UXW4_9PLEO|nr:hypothetical protein M011DRAFT_452013 [Sporormia fimetaria CBS 119925]